MTFLKVLFIVLCLCSLVAQTVKRLPAVHETWVRSLVREDPLEKEMATHSSVLAWETPWTEEPSRLQSMGSQELDTIVTKPPARNTKDKAESKCAYDKHI